MNKYLIASIITFAFIAPRVDAIQAQPVSYTIVLGNKDATSDFGEIKGLTTSFLYSPSGKLVGHHNRPLTQNEIEQAMAQKLSAANFFTG